MKLRAFVLALLLFCNVRAPADEPPLKTIDDRLREFGETVRQRLEPKFRAAGIPYPPKRVTLVAIKQDRVFEVYAAGEDEAFRFICRYPILAASGKLGPKLREGDLQVPEGIYAVRELNPNSLYHLSVWLDFPNAFDWARAREEKRDQPGSEIMIHGSNVSKGCLAMGDAAAEDLFVLAALCGIPNLSVILTPIDFRKESLGQLPEGAPSWTATLYEQLKTELAKLPKSHG